MISGHYTGFPTPNFPGANSVNRLSDHTLSRYQQIGIF
jgi:hypothetical protein